MTHADLINLMSRWGQIALVILILLVVAEALYIKFIEKTKAPEDLFTNVKLFMFTQLLMEQIVTIIPVLAISGWVYSEFAIIDVPLNAPGILGYLLAGELIAYLPHRFAHAIRILWADHSVHHGSAYLNFSTNLRGAPFVNFYRLPLLCVFAFLGFHPVVTYGAYACQSSFQLFAHTDRVGRIPVLDWFLMTPGNHAVHHAINPEYIDKNFGGLFMIWDHVFGTYQPLRDDVIPIFGTRNPVKSTRLWNNLTHEAALLFDDCRRCKGFFEILNTLISSTDLSRSRQLASLDPRRLRTPSE